MTNLSIRRLLSESHDSDRSAVSPALVGTLSPADPILFFQLQATLAYAVLLVRSYDRLRGGKDVVFEAEADMLEGFGHEVMCYTRRNEDMVNQGRPANRRNTDWNRAVVDDIFRMIQEHRIEFEHSHDTFPANSPLSIRAAHEADAVTVQTLHNSRPLCATAVCYRDNQPVHRWH
ncbi:glycosyltransferase family protein [Aporhodopirellula aestuarii]|uniref:Uncharacterized protein n=1 Tax=Aporhodopirellula aestuarii TaxID=2950107 RepID=A0ABT0U7T7_9BACT|nr:hypothetical protein [Aporhodopirellula aestuarii]MCM2372989.1 hypothetical protein [Aporhodopirellula aestuarii]